MTKTKKPSDFKETWIGRLKRKSHELLKSEKAYISKERADEMEAIRKKKKYKTPRSKAIESDLQTAGIDWEEDKPSARRSK